MEHSFAVLLIAGISQQSYACNQPPPISSPQPQLVEHAFDSLDSLPETCKGGALRDVVEALSR